MRSRRVALVRGVTAIAERLPIRLRVALAFTAVMALLLVCAGLFLYLRLGATLRSGIDDGLRTRVADIAVLAQDARADGARASGSPLTERGETLAQILTPTGRIVDASPTLHGRPLLSPAQLRIARSRPILFELGRPTAADPDAADRVLAAPRRVAGRTLIVVVGASVDPVETAQHQLGGLLLVGAPVVLLLAGLAGYGAASAALRPIDRMREQADAIHVDDLEPRLATPPARDEVARLAATLNAMLDRLQDGFEREREFVDDASHEMRTPLALIKAELELAMRPGATEPELREAIRSVAEENDRLVRLAEDLLVLARSGEDAAHMREERMTVAELVEATRYSGTIEIAVDERPDAATIVGDRLRLARALGNLIDNAAAAGATRVRIETRRTADATEIHAIDDGPGFPPDFAARAFDRFSRADHARARGGTGLGLAIVRTIAREHGGEAHAGKAPGGGADVWLTLPD